MLEVTEMAGQKLKEYLTQNNIESAVRVALMNGCGGPSLGLALDEAKATDASTEREGVRVLIDNGLLTQCGGVRVDYTEGSGCDCQGGFAVTASVPLPNTGGGCGGSCSSGGCGC